MGNVADQAPFCSQGPPVAESDLESEKGWNYNGCSDEWLNNPGVDVDNKDQNADMHGSENQDPRLGNSDNHQPDKNQKEKKKNKKKTDSLNVDCHGQLSGRKRKRGGVDDGMKCVKPRCGDVEGHGTNGMALPSVDTTVENVWMRFCHLPILKSSGNKQKKNKQWDCVVSIDDKMVYCGPLSEKQCTLMGFKADVLCNIVKDPHSPPFCVSGDVLMYPIWNPLLMARSGDGGVREIGQTCSLGAQGKNVLSAVPASVLKHCLLRYILDIGDTGLSNLVLQLETNNYVNWNLDKSWGNTSRCRIVRFFESRMSAESNQLVVRCMVLANKTALLEFMDTLDLFAIERAAEYHGVWPEFVNGMKNRVDLIRSELSGFEAKDLLSFN